MKHWNVAWRAIACLAVGAAAGSAFRALHSPLPWMIGPLVIVAALRVTGARLQPPPGTRQVGQWIVGTALALYFTPAVVHTVAGLWPLLAAAAVFAIVNGYLCGIVLARVGGTDRTTAIFASVPGGAAEMATLGERFAARVDQVAAAHSVRILLVVVTLPYAFAALGVHGTDAFEPATRTVDVARLAALLAITGIAGMAAARVRVPNAFVLGPLAIGIPLTAAEVHFSAMPPALSAAAQCLLGCALGARFSPAFLRGARRFVLGVVATVLGAILVCAAFGMALAWAAGQAPPTVILGTAPGGVAEMCLTANALALGVPIVTACHVTRVVVLLLVTAPLYSALRHWRGAGAGAEARSRSAPK